MKDGAHPKYKIRLEEWSEGDVGSMSLHLILETLTLKFLRHPDVDMPQV
jgi:hypothetical protein